MVEDKRYAIFDVYNCSSVIMDILGERKFNAKRMFPFVCTGLIPTAMSFLLLLLTLPFLMLVKKEKKQKKLMMMMTMMMMTYV